MHLILPYHFLQSGCNLRLWEEPYSFSSLTPPSLCFSCLGMFSLPRCTSNNWLAFQKACKENLEWDPDSLCPSVKLAFHLWRTVCHSIITTVPTVPLVWIFISSRDLYHPRRARHHDLDASLESKHSSVLIVWGCCSLPLLSGMGSSVGGRSCIYSSLNSLFNFL